jgi:O-acetyl-ADP-ribose deacetylase (regulator of RNase III)
MLTLVTGSIFNSDLQCLVNPVNTVGVMGGGLAADFKDTFPSMFQEYKKKCDLGALHTGMMHWWAIPWDAPRYICNFPTKEDWRLPSELSYIEAGLDRFVHDAKDYLIESAAFPMLGCGLGGLNFEHQVLPLMVKYLHDAPIDAQVYVGP